MTDVRIDDDAPAATRGLPDDSFFDQNGALEKCIAFGVIAISAAVFVGPTTVGLLFANEVASAEEPNVLGVLFPLAVTWVRFDLSSAQELFFALPVLLGVIFGKRRSVRTAAKWLMVLVLLFVAIGGTIALAIYPDYEALRNYVLTVDPTASEFDDVYEQIKTQIEGTRTAAIAFLAALAGAVVTRAG
ncbi:hypothetical protein [Pseudooceanicola sp. LIPI14-2-Ac024]|uniref:hypothetical protein n=1 Tax=Pseudooceanicola sp. LIPI14-2-Ac024 TaxID=3344875 RepID=UPI0035CEDC71